MGFDMVQVSLASANLCTMEGKTILLVDNRDSFTWNLAHDLERAGAKVVVRQAAECRPEDAEGVAGIVLSPGPGLPSESEGLMSLVAAWAPRKPMLGVCLGLQALVEWSGGRLRQLDAVRHGVSSEARRLVADPMLADTGERFAVGHYHSWCADRPTLPEVLDRHRRGRLRSLHRLALSHGSLPLHAVQFHPESVLTPDGRGMLAAWLATLS